MLSYQERIDRILNTSHIVDINNSTVHRVEDITRVGSIIFINIGGINYQDTEVMTLKEWSDSLMGLEQIVNYLNKL